MFHSIQWSHESGISWLKICIWHRQINRDRREYMLNEKQVALDILAEWFKIQDKNRYRLVNIYLERGLHIPGLKNKKWRGSKAKRIHSPFFHGTQMWQCAATWNFCNQTEDKTHKKHEEVTKSFYYLWILDAAIRFIL